MRELFGVDLRLEGVGLGPPRSSSEEPERPYIVISQEWIDALDAEEPSPSEQEISDFMMSLGFTRMEDSCYRWRRPSDQPGEPSLIVLDTKPDNFIKSAHGVVPIDLIIGFEHEG